jgi:hypothetical protein
MQDDLTIALGNLGQGIAGGVGNFFAAQEQQRQRQLQAEERSQKLAQAAAPKLGQLMQAKLAAGDQAGAAALAEQLRPQLNTGFGLALAGPEGGYARTTTAPLVGLTVGNGVDPETKGKRYSPIGDDGGPIMRQSTTYDTAGMQQLASLVAPKQDPIKAQLGDIFLDPTTLNPVYTAPPKPEPTTMVPPGGTLLRNGQVVFQSAATPNYTPVMTDQGVVTLNTKTGAVAPTGLTHSSAGGMSQIADPVKRELTIQDKVNAYRRAVSGKYKDMLGEVDANAWEADVMAFETKLRAQIDALQNHQQASKPMPKPATTAQSQTAAQSVAAVMGGGQAGWDRAMKAEEMLAKGLNVGKYRQMKEWYQNRAVGKASGRPPFSGADVLEVRRAIETYTANPNAGQTPQAKPSPKPLGLKPAQTSAGLSQLAQQILADAGLA